MLGELAVRAVEAWVVQVGREHSRLEVVRDPEARAATEERERLDVAADPGLPVHLQHRSHEVHAARAQRRHESPDRAAPVTDGIAPHTKTAIVDLHGLAEGGLGQEHGEARRVRRADPIGDVPLEGAQAAVDLAAVVQALPHRRRGRGQQRLRDLLVQRGELAASAHLGRAVLAGRGERRAPLGRSPGRALAAEARSFGLGDALAHGVARVPQAAGDLTDASARAPVDQDLGVVLHGDPPAGHAFHLLSEEAGRAEFRTTPGGSIP